MTFANYAAHFPDYWTGRWSASDSLDSSLLPTNGLSTGIPWCAHAHAWPLYCYLRLTEVSTSNSAERLSTSSSWPQDFKKRTMSGPCRGWTTALGSGNVTPN